MSTSWPWLAVLALLGGCTAEPPAPTASIHFVDVGRDAGLDFTHFNGFSGEYYYVETFGAGAAFLDYDGDWDLDLYLVNGTYLQGLPPDPLPRNHLYQNQGQGTFHNASGPDRRSRPGLRLRRLGRRLRRRWRSGPLRRQLRPQRPLSQRQRHLRPQ